MSPNAAPLILQGERMRKIFLLLALTLAAAGLFAKTTVIYHTSDTHGFFYPKNGQGGFAALAAVLEAGPEHYLLLDSGDFANGTAEAKNSQGLKSVALMNALGYQATTIGNHEFDFRDSALEPLLQNLKFSVLAANFLERKTGKFPPLIKPYKIFDVDGVSIAVIGLANRYPTNDDKMYKFTKPLPALKKALKEVEEQQPDVVVVLVHDGLRDVKHGTQAYVAKIAKKFGGRVNIVLGGHVHNIVQNEYINGTLFVESGCHLQHVSKITVETDDETGKFISAKSEIIPLIVEKVGQDQKIAEYAETLKEAGMDEVFGEAAENINRVSSVPEHKDGPLNDWIADLGRAASGTQIFVHNNGGTRMDVQKGPVTRRDTTDIHPFDNGIVKMTVDGKFLKYLVKKSLLPRSLFTYSGMDVTYRNKNGKVKDLQIFVDGKPVENHHKYTLATNSYIGYGGSEGWPFKKIKDSEKQLIPDVTIRSVLENGLKTQSPVRAVETGRIVEFQ